MSGSFIKNGQLQKGELGTELEALFMDNVFFVSSQFFTMRWRGVSDWLIFKCFFPPENSSSCWLRDFLLTRRRKGTVFCHHPRYSLQTSDITTTVRPIAEESFHQQSHNHTSCRIYCQDSLHYTKFSNGVITAPEAMVQNKVITKTRRSTT